MKWAGFYSVFISGWPGLACVGLQRLLSPPPRSAFLFFQIFFLLGLVSCRVVSFYVGWNCLFGGLGLYVCSNRKLRRVIAGPSFRVMRVGANIRIPYMLGCAMRWFFLSVQIGVDLA